MFICHNCGETFTEFETIGEHHPCGNGTATEEWAVCPCCGDTDFDEAKQCQMCGEYFAELHEGMCDCCFGDMYGE